MYRVDIKLSACKVSELPDDLKIFILELWLSQIFPIFINM